MIISLEPGLQAGNSHGTFFLHWENKGLQETLQILILRWELRMIRQWSVSDISGPTVQIYMGGQGVNRLPPVQKNMCLAPLSTIFFAKKAGDSGPLKSKRFALLTEFFFVLFVFLEMAQRGRQIQILIQSNHRNLIEECSQPGLNQFFFTFFFFKSQDLDIKMSPFFFSLNSILRQNNQMSKLVFLM